MRKPVIGVTTNLDHIAALSTSHDEFIFIRANYINVLLEHGAIPWLLTSKIGTSSIEQIVSKLDGLMLIGGQDVHPSMYGEELVVEYCSEITCSGCKFKRPLRDKPNLERDIFEKELYLAAKKRGIPILGICRGYQLMNVAEGGTLYQELPDDKTGHTVIDEDITPIHEINVQKDSQVYDLIGEERILMSSIHHQGIKDLAPTMKAVAYADDGLVEAIESLDADQLIVGFQGHPERSCKEITEYHKMFFKFVERCVTNELNQTI